MVSTNIMSTDCNINRNAPETPHGGVCGDSHTTTRPACRKATTGRETTPPAHSAGLAKGECHNA